MSSSIISSSWDSKVGRAGGLASVEQAGDVIDDAFDADDSAAQAAAGQNSIGSIVWIVWVRAGMGASSFAGAAGSCF